MASYAVTNKRTVINGSRFPAAEDVAGTALCRGGHVRGWILARCQHIVVALVAGGNRRLGVIERDNRLPLARRLAVARIAGIAGRQSLQMLSGLARYAGERAVVTGLTISHKRGVIDVGRFPADLRMADTALI